MPAQDTIPLHYDSRRWRTRSPSASRKSSRSSTRRRGSCGRTSPSCSPRAPVARRSDQARAAPVDRRGRHQDLRRRRPSSSDEVCHIRRELSQSAERVGLRIAAAGTHPFSNWKDQVISPGERYENIVEELQQLARSLLIFGLHIHVAVPDRGEHDRAAQRGALLPAAPARALDQLAVLAGTRHRPEVVPDDGLPPLSAQRHPRPVRLVERVRGVPRHARRAALHRRRQEGVVGSAAASAVRHARVPHLRRADVAARDDRAGGAGAGDRREAVPAAPQQSRASASIRARWSRRTSGARRATASTAG